MARVGEDEVCPAIRRDLARAGAGLLSAGVGGVSAAMSG